MTIAKQNSAQESEQLATGPAQIPIPQPSILHMDHTIPYQSLATPWCTRDLSPTNKTNKGSTRSHPTHNTIQGNNKNVAGSVTTSQIPCFLRLLPSLHHVGLPSCLRRNLEKIYLQSRAAYKLLTFHPNFGWINQPTNQMLNQPANCGSDISEIPAAYVTEDIIIWEVDWRKSGRSVVGRLVCRSRRLRWEAATVQVI